MMQFIALENYETMSRYAADYIFDVIIENMSIKRFNLGLATGNTMIKTYQILADKLNRHHIDLSALHTYNLDEYVSNDGKNIPSTNCLSYRRYMKINFYDLLDNSRGFSEKNMHFPDALNPGGYDKEIDEANGLDFQLLGIGFNGHIAFNEPMRADIISNDDFAKLPSRVIALNDLTIHTNARLTAGGVLEKVPTKAVTMGMEKILQAKEIMLLACFKEQAIPLSQIKAGKITPELPGSFLLTHPNAKIIFTSDTIDENLA
jgi:glucosamine-6-phosphate deaminase